MLLESYIRWKAILETHRKKIFDDSTHLAIFRTSLRHRIRTAAVDAIFLRATARPRQRRWQKSPLQCYRQRKAGRFLAFRWPGEAYSQYF